MENKLPIPLWKIILHSTCTIVGTALIIYALCVMQPLPMLIGSIFAAVPITVSVLALMQKISDIRFERQWGKRD